MIDQQDLACIRLAVKDRPTDPVLRRIFADAQEDSGCPAMARFHRALADVSEGKRHVATLWEDETLWPRGAEYEQVEAAIEEPGLAKLCRWFDSARQLADVLRTTTVRRGWLYSCTDPELPSGEYLGARLSRGFLYLGHPPYVFFYHARTSLVLCNYQAEIGADICGARITSTCRYAIDGKLYFLRGSPASKTTAFVVVQAALADGQVILRVRDRAS